MTDFGVVPLAAGRWIAIYIVRLCSQGRTGLMEARTQLLLAATSSGIKY